MNKLQTVITALTNKKIRFELDEKKSMLGIAIGPYVWHWFKYDTDFDWLYFDHSYSTNTGTCKSGPLYQIRVKESLSKKTGLAYEMFM